MEDAVKALAQPQKEQFLSTKLFEYELLSDAEIREHIRNCEGKHVQQVAFSTFMDCITQICFTEQKIRSGIAWDGTISTKPMKG